MLCCRYIDYRKLIEEFGSVSGEVPSFLLFIDFRQIIATSRVHNLFHIKKKILILTKIDIIMQQ